MMSVSHDLTMPNKMLVLQSYVSSSKNNMCDKMRSYQIYDLNFTFRTQINSILSTF